MEPKCKEFTQSGFCAQGLNCEFEHDLTDLNISAQDILWINIQGILTYIDIFNKNIRNLDLKINKLYKEIQKLSPKTKDQDLKDIRNKVNQMVEVVQQLPAVIRSQGIPMSSINTYIQSEGSTPIRQTKTIDQRSIDAFDVRREPRKDYSSNSSTERSTPSPNKKNKVKWALDDRDSEFDRSPTSKDGPLSSSPVKNDHDMEVLTEKFNNSFSPNDTSHSNLTNLSRWTHLVKGKGKKVVQSLSKVRKTQDKDPITSESGSDRSPQGLIPVDGTSCHKPECSETPDEATASSGSKIISSYINKDLPPIPQESLDVIGDKEDLDNAEIFYEPLHEQEGLYSNLPLNQEELLTDMITNEGTLAAMKHLMGSK